MAVYESPRYKELGFYVNGNFRRFGGGIYQTDDPEEIAVLDGISDAVRVDEVKTEEPREEPQVVADVSEETTAKPAAKPRKTSAK